MKILYKGTPPEKETLVGVCPRCYSIFEEEQEDVWIGDADHALENKYVAYCPICPREVMTEMHMSSSSEAFNLRIVALQPRIRDTGGYL